MIRAIPEERAKAQRRRRTAGISARGDSARAAARARSRRRWLTTALGIGLIFECAAGALTSPHFYVRNVHVSGTGVLESREAEQTRAAAKVPDRTGILRLNSRGLESRLEALPWVDRVNISRQAPGTVVIDIRPRTPFAVVLAGGHPWQVDRTGVVIRQARETVGVPVIQLASSSSVRAGHRIIDDSFAAALAVAISDERLQSPPIEKIVVDSQAHICLNMSDGIVIRLGPSEEMDAKLALVDKIYREQPNIAARVETIDLTAPENPACRPLSESRKAERAEAANKQANRSGAVEGGSRSD